MTEKELLERVTIALEQNTAAMERSAAANEVLGEQMRKMVAVVTGAQRKIGGELGPVIEKQKVAAAQLQAEAALARIQRAKNGG